MSEVYSPNLFLFQNYIEEVVKEGKKHIRTAPFDTLDPESTSFPMKRCSQTTSHNTWTFTTRTSWLR